MDISSGGAMQTHVRQCDGDGKGNDRIVRHGARRHPSHHEFSRTSIKGISNATWLRTAWVVLAALLLPDNSHSAELEPRYRWNVVNVGSFDSQEEAFAAYKAFEDAANLSRPGTASDITVLGYELVGAPGQSYSVFNNIPGGYQFKIRRPSDCPDFCYAGGMSLERECPSGTSSSTTILGGGYLRQVCFESAPLAEPDLRDCPVGNPIHLSTGMKHQVETDYTGTDGLKFVRTYRSDRNGWTHNYQVALTNVDSMLGAKVEGRGCKPGLGESTNAPYCFRYVVNASNALLVTNSNRRILRFDATTGSPTYSDINDRVTKLVDSGGTVIGWDVYDSNEDNTKRFDTAGRLLTITHRGGHTESLSYSDASTPASIAPYPGLLVTVSSSSGQKLNLSYDSGGRLTSLKDPAGNQILYAYDGASSIVGSGRPPVGNLTSVTYPDSTSRTYWYNEPAHTGGLDSPYVLTGISDESQQRYSTYKYDSSRRAISTEHSGGTQKYSMTFGANQTTVTEPLGLVRTYTLTPVLGVKRVTAVSGVHSAGCTKNASVTYDSSANRKSTADFNGNRTCYEYDLTRNLEVFRVEGFSPGATCPANLSSYTPAPGTRQRKIATLWHATFRTPTQIDEPGQRTNYTHDANGNVLTATVTETATGVARTWAYTYNTNGKVLTADGPRSDVTDVTTYTYYTCTTGNQCGQLNTVTNALGHITTYNTYNAHGRPLTITDPNGVVTTLTYDARQRLKSRTVAGEVTAVDYWPTGLLKKVTTPDGSYLSYTYDAAHRLTGIADMEGNRIAYTLDANGNRTKEETFDPSNALSRTNSRIFDSRGQLSSVIGAAGTPQVTTSFGYDSNGNQISTAAPMSRTTGQSYDELNRLTAVTDPAAGVTRYGYNALDQLISVTDPRNLATTYTYNGLSDLEQQVSPDTGTTTNTYDSGGNVATSTDARGVITTYTYDALNRLKTAAFKLGATTDQTITYNYDAGTYGKGRLTSASDSDHSMTWTYDALGRVKSKSQVASGFTKTVSYGYTNGQLTTMTMPSGKVVTYGYTNNRITSITLNPNVSVLSNVLYEPFGPPRLWTWGNGTLAARAYDQDGKITQIDSAGLKTYSYDDAFRITGITDTTNSANSWTYGYDALDRITSAARSNYTSAWTYDANGNRRSETGNNTQSLTYAATSNRLQALSGNTNLTYSYDATGNLISDTIRTYSYNYRGRMTTSTSPGYTTNYTYNALGERITKSSGTRLFVYDEAGHLIGEYLSTTGAVVQETIWMGDTPVAVIVGNEVVYIHTDHLNAPRKITDASNGVRWLWNPTPFGIGSMNNNPQGLGFFNYYLRFPGQVFDGQTLLHYNYFRDYDPNTGRYVQSDPIGLDGGINTYNYVNGNPVTYVDPSGLFLTSVDAACITNPQFCAEILGQIVENAGAINARLTGDTCAAEEAHEVAETIRTAGKISSILLLSKIAGSIKAAKKSPRTTGAETDIVATRNGLVDVRSTIDRIKAGVKHPHRNDGSIFGNREGLLPRQPYGYYREYVHPTPGIRGPGPQRIVQGRGGELYYTEDHYDTFIPLN
jgi:RHS repeat-associated protein